jgi:hypothetical protein
MPTTPEQEIAKLKDILGKLKHRATEQDGMLWRLPNVKPHHITNAIGTIEARIAQLIEENMIIDHVPTPQVEPPK